MPAEHGFVEPAETPNLDAKLDEAFGPESDLAETIKRNMQVDKSARSIGEGLASTFGTFSRGPGEIYSRMALAMAEVSHVGKTGFNEQQRYSFRGIDAVVNALGPAMRKHGIVPVPELLKVKYRDTLTTGQKPTREVTVKVKYTFIAPDGSCVSAIVPGESLDQSDKGTAKAMSVAYRIALLQVFALPTDEPDPDSSYHTRDGKSAMAAVVATLIADQLPTADANQLALYWQVVLEHGAADRPYSGSPDSPSWLEAFALRYAALIERVETWQQGRDMKSTLDALSFTGVRAGESTLGALLEARATFVKERMAKTFDHVMEQITAADDLEALDSAVGCAEAALEVGTLSYAQVGALQQVAQDRAKKLEEMDRQLAWESFCELTDQMATAEDVKNRLSGGDATGVPPATVFGLAGYQRIYDGIVRLHARDGVIDAKGRQRLVDDLADHLEGDRIEWPAGWKR